MAGMRYLGPARNVTEGRRIVATLDAWRRAAPRPRAIALAWAAVVTAALVMVALHTWVTDDVFITYRYCDNVLAGHGPVYNPGERSEGYTHFLWFILLTIGRALHVDPVPLGRYLPMPFFAISLVLLGRISGRLFPGRGGWFGLPVALVGWAVHEDARLFASGGLETAAFIAALLAGVDALASHHPRRGAWSGWAFSLAVLLRPEGLLYAAMGAAYWAWTDRRALRQYALTGVLLCAPLFVFRMLYYGYPLPNPYYAKSGSLSYWSQGWLYTRTYFGSYFVLLGASLGAIPIRRAWSAPDPDARAAARLLTTLAAAAAATIFLVARGGGDFMFARFFLPTTPFLLLLLEAAVHSLPRPALRAAGTAVCAGLIVLGVVRKHALFGNKKNVAGIVDEPQFYPEFRMREIRELAANLGPCLQGTHATILVGGGQAALAYFTQYPTAVERFGLTDETIAHQPIRLRGRPGHEKFATAEYLYQRGVNLRFHFSPVRNVPQYSLLEVAGVAGDIVVYDRAFMEHLKTCRGARFLDFPRWLADIYIPQVPAQRPDRLLGDWNQFQHFYFLHNPDPEGLHDRLRAALTARGLVNLPDTAAPVLIQDPGLLQR